MGGSAMNQREGLKKYFGIDEEKMKRIEQNRQKKERRKERANEFIIYGFAGGIAALITFLIIGYAG